MCGWDVSPPHFKPVSDLPTSSEVQFLPFIIRRCEQNCGSNLVSGGGELCAVSVI